MRRGLVTIWAAIFAIVGAMPAYADSDKYIGDNAIYTGDVVNIHPNVLFLIDNSAGMTQQGQANPYVPATTYPGEYVSNKVYVRTAATGGTINYNPYIDTINGVTCEAAKNDLTTNGAYYGKLKKSDGSCNASQAGNYYMGNLLNYMNSTPVWAAGRSYAVDYVITPASAGGKSYRCIVAGVSGGTEPTWPSGDGSTVTDGGVTWRYEPPTGDILAMVKSAVTQIAAVAKESVNMGVMVFGDNNQGGRILVPITDLSIETNLTNFTTAVNGITLLNSNQQPVNEMLWDAGLYYSGQNNSTDKIASEKTAYPSPIQYSCQLNLVIVLTTGNSDSNAQTKSRFGDLDSDGETALVDDAAKQLLADKSTLGGTQRVATNIVQLLTPEVPRLVQAAALGSIPETEFPTWAGQYHKVQSAAALAKTLDDMFTNIVKPVDSSFVAPVVPVSPENRTYSGARVYMGFFKPVTEKNWNGNLKKYAIENNVIKDKNGNDATNADGSFKSTSVSFWSSAADAGYVESGGVGEVLLARTTARNIYTYLGSNINLTDSSNAFATTNAGITAALLDVSDDTEKDKVINFVHGKDSYDSNHNANTTEKRSWIMGDILHSRPLIVNYKSYTFAPDNETDEVNHNQSIIYVGSNDGMLHAFKDTTGEEAWAFIPPDVLANLKNMKGPSHHYYADSTPSVYVYDADNDGNIESGDKVILMIGLRRGGGNDSAPTNGYYYALDVTNRLSPQFLWKISSATTGFSELGESWSEPKVVRMNIGGTATIVAFVGAGYDNANEDGRYGATQSFTGTGTPTVTNLGSGVNTSTGSSASGLNPKGRGIYAINITTGQKIWGITNAENSAMNFSFPGEITALDVDNDGYTDRLYTADTGGNLWRFNVGNTNASSWTATKIFSANPSSGTDTGRKIFYKPSAVIEAGYTMLFFGTGDREHPLNRAVVDRVYAIKDNNITTTKTESNLTDVTTDLLQSTTETSGANSVSGILAALNASSGWYIKLNENAGEKVLAPPVVFNKVVYFTTYAPNVVVTDPCDPGNLGVARIYAVDYKTGEAVLNYDTSNDSTALENKRATAVKGQVLLRSDRVKTIGSGIPSGIVILIGAGGDQRALIGVGGHIANEAPKKGGSVVPLYWRRK